MRNAPTIASTNNAFAICSLFEHPPLQRARGGSVRKVARGIRAQAFIILADSSFGLVLETFDNPHRVGHYANDVNSKPLTIKRAGHVRPYLQYDVVLFTLMYADIVDDVSCRYLLQDLGREVAYP